MIVYLPFKTCTVTLRLLAFDGLHWYCPESDVRAFCMSKKDVVVSPFSVITDTPPRGLSYEIMENPSKCYSNIKKHKPDRNKIRRKSWFKIKSSRFLPC